MNSKVIIIGIDGGTFDIILPLIDQGKLPNIESFIRNGSWGVLNSTIPSITMPAWPSLITGVNPGKHGIYNFLGDTHSTYDEGPLINSTHLKTKCVWDILGEFNKKVLVVTVPTTYPPKPVNGITISSIRPASIEQIKSYPQDIINDVSKVLNLNNLRIQNARSLRNATKKDIFFSNLLDFHTTAIDKIAEANIYLMGKIDWSFLMTVFQSSDVVQHHCWSLFDKNHPHHNVNLAKKFGNIIPEIYKKIDDAIGKIMKQSDKNTTFIIVSDHGAGPVHKSFNTNIWLLKEGFLHLKSQKLYRIVVKMKQVRDILKKLKINNATYHLPEFLSQMRLPIISKEPFPISHIVDWNKTFAYATKHGININLKGREPNGIVNVKDYNKIISQIEDRLSHLVDFETGEKVIHKTYRRDVIYNGPYIGDAYDIYIATQNSLYLTSKSFLKKHSINKLTANAVSGHHTNIREGIFLMKGPHCKKGVKLNNLDIVDVAPTSLYLLGLKIPDYFDGKVITNAIEDAFLKKIPIQIMSINSSTEAQEEQLSNNDKMELENQLRSLGYL